MHAGTCYFEQRGCQCMEWGGIALYIGFDLECFTRHHNGDAVITNGAT